MRQKHASLINYFDENFEASLTLSYKLLEKLFETVVNPVYEVCYAFSRYILVPCVIALHDNERFAKVVVVNGSWHYFKI